MSTWLSWLWQRNCFFIFLKLSWKWGSVSLMYKTPLTRQEYHLMSVSSLESWGRFGLRWGDELRGGEGVRYFDTIVILPAGGATTGTEALWASSGSVVGGTLERITLGWQEEGIVTVWWDTGGRGRSIMTPGVTSQNISLRILISFLAKHW